MKKAPTIILSAAAILALTSCGPKALTKTEGVKALNDIVSHVEDPSYQDPTKLTIVVKELEPDETDYAETRLDKDNDYFYSIVRETEDNKVKTMTSYAYLEGNALFTATHLIEEAEGKEKKESKTYTKLETGADLAWAGFETWAIDAVLNSIVMTPKSIAKIIEEAKEENELITKFESDGAGNLVLEYSEKDIDEETKLEEIEEVRIVIKDYLPREEIEKKTIGTAVEEESIIFTYDCEINKPVYDNTWTLVTDK